MTFNLFKLLRLWPPFDTAADIATSDPIRIVYAVPGSLSVVYRVPSALSIVYDPETQT